MKKKRFWIILALSFYLLFLAWSMPAGYALSMMRRYEVIPAGTIRIIGLEGAWTDGRIVELEIGGLKANDLNWRFQPTGLLRGRLQFIVKSSLGEGTVEGTVRLGLGSLAIDKVRGRVPADFLGRRYLPGFSLAGVLETDELSLAVEDGYPAEATGRLSWSNAGVESPYRMGLGGVVVDLSTESDGIVFRLGDTGGALQAAGLGVLSPEGRYSFNGSLGSRQGADSELATYLQILGRPQPDGMVKIQHNGSLMRLF